MTDFTDDQRVEMIENQCEHIISLCGTYVEGDTLEDVGNIRALAHIFAHFAHIFHKQLSRCPIHTLFVLYCGSYFMCDLSAFPGFPIGAHWKRVSRRGARTFRMKKKNKSMRKMHFSFRKSIFHSENASFSQTI